MSFSRVSLYGKAGNPVKLSKSEKRYVATLAAVIASGDGDVVIPYPDHCDNYRLAVLDEYAETLVKNET